MNRERERERDSSWPTYRWYDCIFNFSSIKFYLPSLHFYSTHTFNRHKSVQKWQVPQVIKQQNICVFGGSSPKKKREFLESANHLDQVLAERKIHLVYGGGNLGLMGGVNSCIFKRQSSFGGRPQSFSKRGHHWKNNWRGTTGLHNV